MTTEQSPERQISAPGDIKAFILGGNATFTLKSLKTEKRFTYQVKEADDKKGFFFVKVLAGPDNRTDYTYLGFVKDPYLPKLIAGKKGRPDAPSFKALDWFLSKAWALDIPDGVEFWHAGRCCSCNRMLTDPASIERGIGPECAKKG